MFAAGLLVGNGTRREAGVLSMHSVPTYILKNHLLPHGQNPGEDVHMPVKLASVVFTGSG
jgi:hypothetical protein